MSPIERGPTGGSYEDRAIDEITDFVFKHSLTADQLRSAYELAIGVSQDTTEEPSAEIKHLVEIIGHHIRGGLPLNRITTLIDSKIEFEKRDKSQDDH